MTAVVFTRFGGIMPSMDPFDLPPDSAQIAENLDLRFGDFRPVKGLGASVTTVAAATKSIFKTPSGTWLQSTNDVDYVLGQLQGEGAPERVYLTGRSAYPEAWQAGSYRRLGVPAPSAAPTVTVEVVDEFSTQEMVVARAQLPEQVSRMFLDSLVPTNVGPTGWSAPTTTTPGLLIHGTQPDLPTKSNLQWAFCVPMILNGSDYVMKDGPAHNFLLAAELGGKRITYGGNPYWAIPLYLAGQGATIDTVSATTDLKTVMNPSNTAVRLWTDPEVDTIVNTLVETYDPTNEPLKTLIDNLYAAVPLLQKVYDSAGTGADMRAAMRAFFDRTEVQDQFDQMIGSSTGTSATHSPDVGTLTARVAYVCYQFGYYNPDATTANPVADTRYFHQTTDDPTVANIRADINACLYEDSRGATVADLKKFETTLREEIRQLVEPRADDLRWSETSINSAVTWCMEILSTTCSDTNWAKLPAWPLNRGVTIGDASAAVQAREAVKAACDAITNQYEQLRKYMLSYIANKMFDNDILPKLPKVVDRISETRSYIYTYITDWGEESAPSPPTELIECDQNDIVTLVAPIPPTGWNIKRMNVYRSSSSNMGSAFQFVVGHADDVSDWTPAGTRTLVDNFKQEALGDLCKTISWDMPPDDGRGLVGMPNGIQVMFTERSIRPCEPFYPHAYPLDYEQPLEFDFVSAGVFGTTAVVLTTGNPYFYSGADSENMSAQKAESNQSCISKRSVAVGEGGLFYASPDGICLAEPGVVNVVSGGIYSRDDWLALDPANSIGRFHDGVYYLFLLTPGKCLSFDLRSKRVSTMNLSITGAFVDKSSDTMYVVDGTAVKPMFGGALLTGKWKSKVLPYSKFSRMRVTSRFEAPVIVRTYVDGVLLGSTTFTSREPQTQPVPAGPPRDIEYQIESTARVTKVAAATSMKELAST